MPEPTACARARSHPDSDYCDRCDLLVGLDGFHVIDVAEREDRRGVSLGVVESPPRQEGCRVCGVIAHSHGRRTVRLADAVHGTAGGGGVAQADLALRRIHLPDRGDGPNSRAISRVRGRC